jgi:hypothetical protein
MAHIEYFGPCDPVRFAETLPDEDWHPDDRNTCGQVGAGASLQDGIVERAMLHLERHAIGLARRMQQHVGAPIAVDRQHLYLDIAR